MQQRKEVWERRTGVAIVYVLERDNGSKYVQIEYNYDVHPDARSTYPVRFEGVLLFDLPERVTDELREAVLAAFDWMGEQ